MFSILYMDIPKEPSTLKERIEWAMATCDPPRKWPELTAACGLTRGATHHWRNGTTKHLNASTSAKLAAFLKVNRQWLEDGTGEPRPISLVGIGESRTASTATLEADELLAAFKVMTPTQRTTFLEQANAVASQNIDVINSFWSGSNDRRRSLVGKLPKGQKERRVLTETDNFAGKPPPPSDDL